MSNNPTISPEQFMEGMHRLLSAAKLWGNGNTWIGDEPPTDAQYAMWVNTFGDTDKLYYKDSQGNWKELATSGGGISGASIVAMTPVSELSQNVSTDDECDIVFEWSSTASETSNGTVTVLVNSVKRHVGVYPQGEVTIPISSYLVAGRTNIVEIVVKDIFGTENSIEFSIAAISVVITSSFKHNTVLERSTYPTEYLIPIVVKGGLNKTVHVIMDGLELTESSIVVSASDSGVQKYIKIPAKSHGVHPLEIYATVEVNNRTLTSNKLHYDIMWIEEGNTEILISSSFRTTEADQFENLTIPYFIFNPVSESSEVFFEVNGDRLSDIPKVVARKQEEWEVSGDLVGENTFKIVSSDSSRSFVVNLNKVETVDVSEVTDEMLVCLIADDVHDNAIVDTRDSWISRGTIPGVVAEFGNFNWKTNGWVKVDGSPALNISDGATLRIPHKIFQGFYIDSSGNKVVTDFKDVGGTIELEFLVTDVTNADEAFLTCMSNGKGIEIKPHEARLKPSGDEVRTPFCSDEKIRVSFVISPEDPGIMSIYLNGTGSGGETYTSTDSFVHDVDPSDIVITSNSCSVNLFGVRVYRSALTQQQIINNWIYDMASVANQVNATKRNDIYDSTTGEILFSKLVSKIPCMTIIGERPAFKGDKKIVDIKFEGTEDGLYDFEIYQVEIDVQGTSSQFYPTKNLKYKSKYKVKDAAGNEIATIRRKFQMAEGEVEKYSLGQDQIPATVFCLKADFMESSSTHNTKTADIANRMYSKKTPPQAADDTGRTRTTIYGRPILVFYKDTEDSEPVFGGKFNFNYDKDAEDVFGFVEDNAYEVVECVEFCNNTSDRCLLHKSEYVNTIYDATEDKDIPEYTTDFEFRYQWRRDDNGDTPYAYLKAATDWVVTTDRSQATGQPLATPYITNEGIATYLYDLDQNIITFTDSKGVTRKAIDIGLGVTEFAYEEHTVDVTDEEGNTSKVTYYALPVDEDGKEVYSFTHDTEAYRLCKFKTEFEEHFDKHFSFMYFLLMMSLGMIDSGTKNCFWATWGERHEKHPIESGDKVVIWYPIFYDMDTMLGLSNAGKMDIPSNVEFNTKLADSDIGYAFNGASNVFWNNLQDAFGTELRTTYRSKVSEGMFAPATILDEYKDHGEIFPEVIYNEDAKIKLIDPLVEGYYGYSEDSPDAMVLQHPDYMYIMQGPRHLYRKLWYTERYHYMCSWLIAGAYQTDYITMRLYSPENMIVPANADFQVITCADQYTRVKYGSKTVYEICSRNQPSVITAPNDKFNDTETIIYGASKIMSLGDLSGKYARSIDLSKAIMLVEAWIGSDVEGYRNANLDEINFGSNKMLQLANVQNCPNLTGTLDLGSCPKIKFIEARGTSVELLEIPQGGILESVHLPETMKRLTIVDHSKLTDLTIEKNSTDNYILEAIRIENSPVDSFELISNSPNLVRLRVVGVDWHIDDDTVLNKIKSNCKGFNATGSDIDRPIIIGDVEVTNIKDYLRDELDAFYNGVSFENLPEFEKRDFRLTAKNVVKTHIVRFFDSVSDTPMYSGITDNRVITKSFAHYGGATPVKEEDWAKTYEFSSWGVYVDGELKPVTDLSTYPITQDTDFYAIYAETEKIFTINFYRQNADTGYYDLYKSEEITYDEAVVAETFPDEFAHEDYALRFKGWNITAGADVAEVIGGGVIVVSEGSPYVQDFYAVYTIDYKYRITFVDYNDTVLKDTVIYYTGDEVVAPTDITRNPDTQYVYTFAGWSLDGENVIEIPEVGGNNYNITYKAVYSYELRPYTIQFVDYNGTVLKTETVRYSMMPTPPENPTREETAQYFYDFDGWDKEVSAVTGDTTYTATYLPTLRTYTVTWVNEDGSSLLEEDVNVPYGTMPSYDGATPTKPATAQYTYTFAGWHIDIETVTGHITYIATYTAEVNKYTVTWKNADGTVLETDAKVPYGDMPEYNKETPKQASSAQYDFTFAGWDTAVSEVTKDVVYTATYTHKVRRYTIKFVDYNGTVLSEQSVEYGTKPTAPTPTRTGYDFTGWDKSVVAVENEATYKAQYKIKTFAVTWELGDKSETETYSYGDTPKPPYNAGDSIAIGNSTFIIQSWSPAVSKVTSDITYTARASGSIIATPTKVGASTSLDNYVDGTWTKFLQGTVLEVNGGTKMYYAFLYGFDFSALANKKNVVITGITVNAEACAYSRYTGYGTLTYQFVSGFNTSGTNTSTYTDLGDGEITLMSSSKDTTKKVYSASAVNMPSVQQMIDGLTDNTFGMRMKVRGINLYSVSITLNFTCEF